MNRDTGELRHLLADQEIPTNFTPVPNDLVKEANKELGGQSSVMVDMTKDTPLVRWAKQSKPAKKRNHIKQAKESRRNNRKRD